MTSWPEKQHVSVPATREIFEIALDHSVNANSLHVLQRKHTGLLL